MLIAALDDAGGAEVSAAHMRCDGHPLRSPGKRLVDVPDGLDVLPLGVTADRGGVGALPGVLEVGQAHVIELQICAAELTEATHLVAKRRGDPPTGIDGSRIGRLLALPVRCSPFREIHRLRGSGRERGSRTPTPSVATRPPVPTIAILTQGTVVGWNAPRPTSARPLFRPSRVRRSSRRASSRPPARW